MNNMSPNPNSLLMFDNPIAGNKNVKKMLFTPDKRSMGDQFDDSVLGDPLTEAIRNIELRHNIGQTLEQHNSLGFNFHSGRKDRSARKSQYLGTPVNLKREHIK